MATRIKDWIIPYAWGIGIEITNNHVINVLLRELNNLIHVNEDRELYVDLQIPDGVEPDYDFEVGVTTWRILEEDWRPKNATILNWKTTSWDYVRLIYANDNKLYYDPWTWQWIELGWSWGWSVGVATASVLGTIKLGSDTKQTEPAQTPSSSSWRTYAVQLNNSNQALVNVPWTDTTYTAWANIVIDNNNVISTTIPQALVYKGNVTWLSDLQNISNPSVWDTYFVEWEDAMYSWDWTQWNYVWGTWIDVTNLFNKIIDNSDDIIEWSIHLFCTAIEKNYWNWKQDALTAGTGIDLTSNIVTNTLPFNPENAWVLAQVLKKTSTWYRWANEVEWFNPENAGSTGQVLKKTNTGYAWANESWWGGWWWGWTDYTAGNWISITGHVITNTKPFEPSSWGTAWQVLTKTANWYERSSFSSAQDVKVWQLPLNNPSNIPESTLMEIAQWCTTSTHSAIIKPDTLTSSTWIHVFWYIYTDNQNVAHYYFPWIYDTTDITNSANGDFTTEYNPAFMINYDGTNFTCWMVYEKRVGNYLTVENSNYVTPYMPTADYQPATKAYVDSINRTGTLSQYNALVNQWQIDPNKVYNITSLS